MNTTLNDFKGENMKKFICMILVVISILSCVICLSSCGEDDSCFICGGSGYYQKKDCPGC